MDRNALLICGLTAFIPFLVAAKSSVGEESSAQFYNSRLKKVVQTKCSACHGPKKQKGKIRLDTLDPDIIKGPDTETWNRVLAMLNKGEMPPKKKPQLTNAQRITLVNWLTTGLNAAAEYKRGEIATIIRRLNREQYSNTLSDLLGVKMNHSRDLPKDARSREGFYNNGEELRISDLQLEQFMKIGRAALDQAIVNEKLPSIQRFRIEMGKKIEKNKKVPKGIGYRSVLVRNIKITEPLAVKDFQFKQKRVRSNYEFFGGRYVGGQFYRKLSKTDGNVYKTLFVDMRSPIVGIPTKWNTNKGWRLTDEGVEIDSNFQWGELEVPAPNLKLFIRDFARQGSFVFRVKASLMSEGDTYLHAIAGSRTNHSQRTKQFAEQQKVKPGEPAVYEFVGRFEDLDLPNYEDNPNFNSNLFLLGVINQTAVKGEKGPSVAVHYMELETPYLTTWPPPSHKRIFIDAKDKGNKAAYARQIIGHFMKRAYRRPLQESELNRMMGYWTELNQDYPGFEDSIKETLLIVMCSPKFLFINEPAKKPRDLTDYELASRLSYFLWNSMPDEELFDLASKRLLKQQLDKQIQRMIKDPKSWNFVTSYIGNWLEVDLVDRKNITDLDYRKARQGLKAEAYHYFNELLQQNLKAFNFVDSDFIMVNEATSRFYKIENIKGIQFRRHEIGPESHLGGFVTQSALITGHSAGDDTHPIKRGTWFLRKFVDDPPADPPPDVPTIDAENPEFNQLKTFREKLALHTTKAACADCHKTIDPWGLAFEEYNGFGKFRGADDGGGANVTLPDGMAIKGMAGLKAYLAKNKKRDVGQALVKSLTSYALGRSLCYADKKQIKDIINKAEKNDFRIQDTIALIVRSSLFQKK